jgi:hypothetical protein
VRVDGTQSDVGSLASMLSALHMMMSTKKLVFNKAKKRMLSNSPSSFFCVIIQIMDILQSANPSVKNGWLIQGEDSI